MVDAEAQSATEIMKERPCPHCRARSRLMPDPELRWVCGVCGGPRVPVQSASAHSEREDEELRRAGRAKKMAFAYRMFGAGLSLTGALLAGLGVVLSAISVPVALVLILAAIPAIVFGIVYGRRARAQREEAKRATFEAWESVAHALLVARGGELTAKEIAREMDTSVDDVERMMSFLSVDNRARVVLREEDSELLYTSGETAAKEEAAKEEEALAEMENEEVSPTPALPLRGREER